MTQLTKLSFCPTCGAQSFVPDSKKSYRCTQCNFLLYLNIGAAVGAVIDCGGKILLIKRAIAPEKGMLDLPGGFVDQGENAEEALRREINEEVGLKFDSCQYFFSTTNIYPYHGMEYHCLDLFYRIKLPERKSISVTSGEETADYFWFELGAIPWARVAFLSNQQALLKYQEIYYPE